jgi:hypothetical protein
VLSTIWQGAPTLLVSLHGRAFPTDDEWDHHLDRARRVRELIGDTAVFRVLVFSDGGGPTSGQRARLIQRARGQRARGALVTDSRLAAGIGTVMSLTYPGVKIFAPRDVARALAHLEVPQAGLASLLAHIRTANAELHLESIAETLATLAT